MLLLVKNTILLFWGDVGGEPQIIS